MRFVYCVRVEVHVNLPYPHEYWEMVIVQNFDFVGWADRVAISTSGICALHCLALPVILSVFPAIGGFFIGEEAFHIWLKSWYQRAVMGRYHHKQSGQGTG